MPEYSKINFNHRKEISDYSDLVEMLFPGNRNQQHAAACIFFELKWSDGLVSNLCYIENKYDVSRRILQRARAKLSRLGLIEHISNLNSRYGGSSGWRLSSRFENAIGRVIQKVHSFRSKQDSSRDKERFLLELMDARRQIGETNDH